MTMTEIKRAAFLFFVPALLFFHPALTGHTLFVGDVTYSFQPWLTYAAQEIQSGRFPLWNPYSACGEPFAANPQVMIFNPAAILYWIFPFTTANALFLLMNQGLLYCFTYFLARRWVGRPTVAGSAVHGPASLAAMGLAWGGFALSHWEFPSAIATLWSLPLFFLLGLGENWIGLAIGWALTFFSGYTQFSYYAAVLAGAGAAHAAFARQREFSDRARVFLFLAASTAVGILLALPQILISWENARFSFRAVLTAEGAQTHVLSPMFFLKLWIPRVTNAVILPFQERSPFGSEFWSIQRNWLATFFMGTPLCLLGLAGLARGTKGKTLCLAAVGAVGAMWAFGIAPFFEWSRTLVPGLRYLTHFANASILIWLCLGLASTNMAHPQPRRHLWIGLIAGGMLVTALGLALSPEIRGHVLQRMLGIGQPTPDQDRWVMQAGGTAATAVLMFAGTWLFFRHQRWAALWAMTLVELWLFGRGLQPWGPAELFHTRPTLASSLAATDKRLSLSPPMMKDAKPMVGSNLAEGYESLREALYPNVPLPYRVHQTWSYEVFGIKEFVEFRRQVPDRPGPSVLLDFLGAEAVLSTTDLPAPSRYVGRRPNVLLYHRPNVLGRTTVVNNAVPIASPEERLAYMSSRWDPRREVVVERLPQNPGDGRVHDSTAVAADGPRLAAWSDGPGQARAVGAGKGWLVRSETYYPGWKCWVNGQRVPIVRANHSFQAVPVPDGNWKTHWRYRSPLFEGGLWISALTGLLGLGGAVRRFTARLPAKS